MDALGNKLLSGKNKRVWEIDFLRGLCIVLMIFDHMMFDFLYLPYMALNFSSVDSAFFRDMSVLADFYWYDWIVRLIVRNLVVFFFLFMSGISCSLTRGNGKRLRKMAIAAGLVSIVTMAIDAVADAGLTIAFGILHIMALSLLIYILMKKLFPNPNFYILTGAVIVGMSLFLQTGGETVPFWEIGSNARRDYLYFLDWDNFLLILGGTHLYGSDSYGVFPYVGYFLLGAGFGELFYEKKRSLLPVLDGRWNKAYSFVGRHGIAFYLAHQVLVFLLIALAAMAAGYEFF